MDKILVIGATGVIGNAVIEHCSKQGLPVVGLSRRAKDLGKKNVEYVAADITNKDSMNQVTAQLKDVTIVIYAAYVPKETLKKEKKFI